MKKTMTSGQKTGGRERYEDWCALWIAEIKHPKNVVWSRDIPAIGAAIAKRDRKAAKRRRDAELTRLGIVAGRACIEDRASRCFDALLVMAAIRRGEVKAEVLSGVPTMKKKKITIPASDKPITPGFGGTLEVSIFLKRCGYSSEETLQIIEKLMMGKSVTLEVPEELLED